MYKSFRVKNYRCFEDLTVEPLERVNLIAGKNNVGKTALLEALWLRQQYDNPGAAPWGNLFRGLQRSQQGESLWELFRQFDADKTIEFCAEESNNVQRCLRIKISSLAQSPISLRKIPSEGEQPEFTPSVESQILFEFRDDADLNELSEAIIHSDGRVIPTVPRPLRGFFVSSLMGGSDPALANKLSELLIHKKELEVLEVLRIIENRLRGINVLPYAGVSTVFGDIGLNRLMPLALLGEGMNRLLTITVALVVSEKLVCLIDEIENGIHYSVMKHIWKAVAAAARDLEVQVFATTHSEECIRSAHEAFSESENYDFRLHRLEYADGLIKSVTYDQEALGFALDSGWEVRG